MHRVRVLEQASAEGRLARDALDRGRIQEPAELRLAQQFTQFFRVDRQRLGAALGERRVALVHEIADVRKQQRRGVR